MEKRQPDSGKDEEEEDPEAKEEEAERSKALEENNAAWEKEKLQKHEARRIGFFHVKGRLALDLGW
ncbi:hypothetical protein IMZ48_43335 [Candidatus Bathyarchaeota archaeon]|nr:hypothetical protein [Candidatus Bathyarchaeota archaeon]